MTFGELSGYCAPNPDNKDYCAAQDGVGPYGSLNPAETTSRLPALPTLSWSSAMALYPASPKLNLMLDKESLAAADKSRLVLYVHDHDRGTQILKFPAADTSATTIANTYTWTGVSNPWRVGFATSIGIWVPGLSKQAIAGH